MQHDSGKQITCGLVKKHLPFREVLVTIVTHEGFLVALQQINFFKTLPAAVRTTMRQFDAVPSMHAVGKAVEQAHTSVLP
mmetsp:Transcript_13153/g.23813  ORF Transcript_13153/g.23813 Transcript_13153/m.23813 type:complete len:80 (-) Transcript_13153:890-1129(-)